MYDRKRIIRDVPVMIWLFGLFTIGIGIYGFFDGFLPFWVRLLMFGIGLAMLLLPTILNVYVDTGRRVLEIERIRPVGSKQIEVPFGNIQRIFVDRRTGRDSDGDRTVTYQVILVLENGDRIPLRESYSGARRKHERYADLIASEVGVDQVDHAPDSIGEALAMAMQRTPVAEQEAQTGIAPGVHETDGIRWQLEAYHYANSTQGEPVYRWSTPDVELPNDFVFIVQKMEGMGQQKGLMKLAGKFLFKTSLQLYGLDQFHTPGLDLAQTLEDVDKRLVEKYFVFTNKPGLPRQLLNPWMVMPLIGWSQRYELSPGDKQMHQLSVLFSPLGLFVSQLGRLDQAEVDQLVSLGIELARAK